MRGGGDEDGTARGTDAAERFPVDRSGVAAASRLTRAIKRGVEIGLANADVFPVNIELLGDDHGEGRFNALADFGISGSDGEDVVGGDLDVSEGHIVWGRRSVGLRDGQVEGVEVAGDEETAGGERGELKEVATAKECDGHMVLQTLERLGGFEKEYSEIGNARDTSFASKRFRF